MERPRGAGVVSGRDWVISEAENVGGGMEAKGLAPGMIARLAARVC